MKLRAVLASLLFLIPTAAADPAPEIGPPPAPPAPEPQGPITRPEPIVTTIPGSGPPITITITNNNTGNNNNTNTATNTAPVTTTQTQTTTATVTMAPLPVVAAPSVRARIDREELLSHRAVFLGVLGTHHGGAASASIDLLEYGAWDLGVSGEVGARDKAALAYVAWSTALGGFGIRAQVGAGYGAGGERGGRDRRGGDPNVARGAGPGSDLHGRDRGHAGAPIAQAALLVSHALTDRWGLAVGPVVTTSDLGHGGKGAVDVGVFAGLRMRL